MLQWSRISMCDDTRCSLKTLGVFLPFGAPSGVRCISRTLVSNVGASGVGVSLNAV
jgi:hypothetical protein